MDRDIYTKALHEIAFSAEQGLRHGNDSRRELRLIQNIVEQALASSGEADRTTSQRQIANAAWEAGFIEACKWFDGVTWARTQPAAHKSRDAQVAAILERESEDSTIIGAHT